MPDQPPPGTAGAADGEVAVAQLESMSTQIRGCVVLGPDDNALAASGDLDTWAASARELMQSADTAAGEAAGHVHVGTEDGEAFAVRLGDYTAVAVAERFALTSLVLSDMRAVLRDLAADPGVSLIREAPTS